MKQLVLAEKPNVAQKIAQALECKIKQNGYMEGEKYVITWASGHLLKLYDARDYEPEMARWDMENFPFIPQKFRYKKIKSYEKQLSIIKRLVQRNDIENFIVATDADREGQLIGETIIDFLKVNKPVYRVLRNEWTPEKFRYKKIKSSEKQLSIIKRLVQRNDIDNFIVATDADREWQLIGETIIDFLKVKGAYRLALQNVLYLMKKEQLKEWYFVLICIKKMKI